MCTIGGQLYKSTSICVFTYSVVNHRKGGRDLLGEREVKEGVAAVKGEPFVSYTKNKQGKKRGVKVSGWENY